MPSAGSGDLDDVTDELYGLAPSDFTARRNDLARQARSGGDRDLADAISALRRPTVSAWLLNQWSRRHPDRVGSVVALGAALRDAQRRGAGDRLRELSVQRHALITRAAAEVGGVADALDHRPSAVVDREIVQTLRAAVADDATAQLVARGRLAVAVEYTGFGPAGMVAVADEPPESAAAEGSGRAVAVGERREEAERSLRDARERRRRARDALSAGTAEVSAAQREVAEQVDVVDRLRADMDHAEQQLQFARRVLAAAEDAVAVRADALAAAEEEVTAARRVLDQAAGP